MTAETGALITELCRVRYGSGPFVRRLGRDMGCSPQTASLLVSGRIIPSAEQWQKILELVVAQRQSLSQIIQDPRIQYIAKEVKGE